MKRILITGVRGKTGRQVAAQLAELAECELIGGTTDPQSLDVPGVAPVVFDWARPDTWATALDEVDAVYLVRPDIEAAADRLRVLISNLPPDTHVVFLSEFGADRLPPDAWPARVERVVADHAPHWTVLRPSWFMQVFTDPRFYSDAIARAGRIALPTRGAAISWVDVRDIAAVAVRALIDPAHAGRSYEPTGPRAITLAETAALLAAASGRTVTHDDSDIIDAVDASDPWLAGVVAELYQRVIDGGFATVTADVQQVTSRPARTFEDFATEHAGQWRTASD